MGSGVLLLWDSRGNGVPKSLRKPGLPGGRESNRVCLNHCSALNPQPASAAAGREETESHGGEVVTRGSALEAPLSPVVVPCPILVSE